MEPGTQNRPPLEEGTSRTDGEITDLLLAWAAGDEGALDELMPRVYDELHRLASRSRRRERDAELQTTDLLHEAYLRLTDQRRVTWKNRDQFFALAAQAMRRVLVDLARRRSSAKRGAGVAPLPLDPERGPVVAPAAEMLALDQALHLLVQCDPEAARIFELRFFGGLDADEVARLTELSVPTVNRRLRAARAFLARTLTAAPEGP